MIMDKTLFLKPMAECCLHINPELEVIFVKKGCVSVNAGYTEFAVSENQFTIIQPYRLHGFNPSENTDATVYMFPNSMVTEFYSLCRNKDALTPVFSLDKVTSDYIVSATEKFLKTSGNYYAKSILNTFLAEFTVGNTFTQMSFDVSNVSRIAEYIFMHIQDDISAKTIAKEFNISESKLNDMILNYSDLGYKEFTDSVRIGRAINLLRSNKFNITEVAYESGFETIRTFNRIFMKFMGCTPSEYKKQKNEEAISAM